jgi:hypothetical protein
MKTSNCDCFTSSFYYSAEVLVSECAVPSVSLIPDSTSPGKPVLFRKSDSFHISSHIDVNCSISLSMHMEWTIKRCVSTCSTSILLYPSSLVTTNSELFIAARSLDYGLYELTLTVTMFVSSRLNTSSSVYVQIDLSDMVANIFPLGTSSVTSSHNIDLVLDPGTHSMDPDSQTFNASVSECCEQDRWTSRLEYR